VLALQSVSCDSRVGGTEPAKYHVYPNYHSSEHKEDDVCFHLPGCEHGSVAIHYFTGPVVDCDVSQPEGLEFGYIKGRIAGASFEDPDQPLHAIDAIFQSIKKPYWNARFRSGWTD
jgi:hypothetical protein